ncbi:MAG TPA: Gfo/Idh/MocA family oxidoreductase [Gemmataceae bacterium]|nr:Gfo/Idh/MocA family oxidoreductase [Gemmataceae bacterium]
MRRVRTAVIGCGKVGRIHADALKSVPEAEFAAVCDSDAARTAAFAENYGVRPYTDIGDLLKDSGAEAVILCTPHPLHAGPAIRAAEAGVHVLVEKPLAANLADCDAMLAAADKTGTKLGVVSQRRFFEPVRRMREAIDAGKIGRPALGTFLMLSWRDEAYYRSDPWRGRWDTEGGGVLVNQSPHQFDLLHWFMGPIEEISGCWANLNHPSIEVDDSAVAAIRFKNGGLGSIVTSVSQKPGVYTKVHVHGSNGASIGVQTDTGATFIAGMTGMAEPPFNDVWTVPGEEALLAGWQAEDRERFRRIDPVVHYHALQDRDFLQAVLEGRKPQPSGRDGRAVAAMFTAIYRSNRERRAVRMEELGERPA